MPRSELCDPVFTTVVTIQISTSCFLTNNMAGAWGQWEPGCPGPPTHGRPRAGAEDAIAAERYFSSHTAKPLSRIQGLSKPADTSSSRPARARTEHFPTPGAERCTLPRLPSLPPPRDEGGTGKERIHHGRSSSRRMGADEPPHRVARPGQGSVRAVWYRGGPSPTEGTRSKLNSNPRQLLEESHMRDEHATSQVRTPTDARCHVTHCSLCFVKACFQKHCNPH